MNLKFSELNLDPKINAVIEKIGYLECTPIQTAVIPQVLAGKDVSGLAQTGTGKTAAFLIPLMDRILKGQFQDWAPTNFVLILVPTRELAEQVYDNIAAYSESTGLTGVAVYGGTGYDKQKEAFRKNVDFVVATPGRLIDLYKDNCVDLKQVRAIVFDEADRMFDMGFKDDMKFILQRVPRERQFLVFSATLNFDVMNTAYMFGAEPIEIDVSRDQAKAENVKDEIFHCGHDEKPMYLLSILKKYNPRQVIIFSNFKFNVERIASFLSQNAVPAMGISSLLTQAQRTRVIELFKAENEKNILVATDVAARGLDIKGVDMVINYELPNDAESYVHRIGRTGRAGAEGLAFSLVCDRDIESLARVEVYLKHKLPSGWMEEEALVKEFSAFPREDVTPGRSNEPGGDRPAPRSERGPRRDGRGGGRGGDRGRDRGPQKSTGPNQHGQGGGYRADRTPRNPDGTVAVPVAVAGEPAERKKFVPSKGASDRPVPPRHANNGNGKAGHQRHQNNSGGYRKPTASAKTTTTQKVASFFKKLFGGGAAKPAAAAASASSHKPNGSGGGKSGGGRHHGKPKSGGHKPGGGGGGYKPRPSGYKPGGGKPPTSGDSKT